MRALGYVVVRSRRPGSLTSDRLQRMVGRVDDVVGAESTDRVVWLDDRRQTAFLGWAGSAATSERRAPWVVDDTGLTAVAGRPVPVGGWSATDGTPLVDQVARRARTATTADLVSGVAGVRTLIRLSSNGVGIVSPDPLGYSLVYEAQGDGFRVFGSPSGLVATAVAQGPAPRRDPLGVGWLAYAGRILDLHTGHADVRSLPVGAEARFGPAGARVLESALPIVPAETRGADAADAIESAAEGIAALVEASAQLPASCRTIDLTGGKDSRLVLAAAVGLGLGDRFVAQTYGPRNSPDHVVARHLAAIVDMPHRAATVSTPERPYLDSLADHLQRTEGQLSLADRRWPVADPDQLRLSGLCGELLSSDFLGVPAETDADGLLRWLQATVRFDEHELLLPDVRMEYEARVRSDLDGWIERTGSTRDGIDAWYATTYLRRWFGAGEAAEDATRLFPLYAIPAVSAAARLDPARRHDETIHLELVRRWCPELVVQPFAGRGWSPHLVEPETVGRMPEADDEGEPDPELVAAVADRWRREARDRRATIDELLATPTEAPWEIFDRERARAALTAPMPASPVARRQLLGAIVGIAWLLGVGDDHVVGSARGDGG